MNPKQFGFYFLLAIIVVMAIKLYAVTVLFLPAIATSCVLACILKPVYRYLLRMLNNATVSAVIVITFFIVLVLVPVTLIAVFVQEQFKLYFNEDMIGNVQNAVDRVEQFLTQYLGLSWSDNLLSNQLPKVFSWGQDAIALLGSKLLVGLTSFVIGAYITIFLLYYLLLNADNVGRTLGKYFPLNEDNYNKLLDEMGKNTRSLVFGQLIIAILQGALASLGFVLFGVPGVIVWGPIMILLSFIPMLGSGIIWVPAASILLFKGDYLNGIGLLLWGAIIVGLVDNFLRPKITSVLGNIHPVTVLIGVIVGIKEWGLIGIVLGPLLISVLITLIRMFHKEYFEKESPVNT